MMRVDHSASRMPGIRNACRSVYLPPPLQPLLGSRHSLSAVLGEDAVGEEEEPGVGPLGALWVSAQLCLAFACCVLLTSQLLLSELSFLTHKKEQQCHTSQVG